MALTDQLHLHIGHTFTLHPQKNGCPMGKVENPPLFIGPPVGHSHMEMFAVRQIDDTDHTPKRDRPVRSRQPLHIEDLAVRSLPSMELLTVPGGNPAILNTDIQLHLSLRDPGAGTQRQA